MAHIQIPLNSNSITQDQDNNSVTLMENHLGRCPQNALEVICSYLDGKALMAFRLVQKMSSEQEKRYSMLLNQHFQFKLTNENKTFPSSYKVLQWAQYCLEMTGCIKMRHFPLTESPIFSAFDTAHLPKSLQTMSNLNRLAQLFEDQKRPLKGLNFISLAESDHINPLIKDLVSAGPDHPIARAIPDLEHLYLRTDKKIDSLPALLKKVKPLRTLDLNNYLPVNDLLRTFTDEQLRQHFHALQTLDLPNTGIRSSQLARLLKSIETPLKSLSLFGCENIDTMTNDLNGKEMATIFGPIEDLELGLTAIRARNLAIILKSCQSLTRLSLTGCSHIAGFSILLLEKEQNQILNSILERIDDRHNFLEKRQRHQSLEKDYREKLHIIFGKIHALDLSRASINTFDLHNFLTACCALTHLDLRECNAISETIKGLSKDETTRAFANIQILNLESTDITATALAKVLKSCHSLKKLNLSHCGNLTEAIKLLSMEELTSIFDRVTDLDLSSTKIQAPELHRLLMASRSLSKFNLGASENLSELITGLTLYERQYVFGHISDLNIGCTKITPDALVKLLPVCHSLKKLSLMFCESVSEAITILSLEALTEIFAPIQSLEIRFTKLTSDAANKLSKAAPHLKKDIAQGLKKTI